MTIIENNAMIAEFMGYKVVTIKRLGGDSKEVMAICLEYNSSWDWLMPVVSEVKLSYSDSERAYEAIDRLDNCLMECDIEAVYDQVVDMIGSLNKPLV